MLNKISKLTESKNKIVNSIVLGVMTFIVVCLLCVMYQMAFGNVHYSYNL